MLERIRHWLSSSEEPQDEQVRDLLAWAQARQFRVKRVRGSGGFVVEGYCSSLENMPWRLEWGASQRPYIPGEELRLRMELGLPEDLHLLLLSFSLKEALSAQAFERWTQSNQTIMDVDSPEEMRWLALYPQVDALDQPRLRGRMVVFSPREDIARAWLQGPLCAMLAVNCDRLFEGDAPFILMTMRGRLYLRLQCADPSPEVVSAAARLFDCAAVSVRKAAALLPSHEADSPAYSEADEWTGRAPVAWNSELSNSDLLSVPMSEGPGTTK
jgi:hypothetical protein